MPGNDVPSTSRTFRESALREYMQERQDSVIPAFTGSASSALLWFTGLASIMVAVVFLHMSQVPRQTSVTVVVDHQAEVLVSTLPEGVVAGSELTVTVDPGQPPVLVDGTRLVTTTRNAADVASRITYPVGSAMLEELGDSDVSVYDTRGATVDLTSGVYPGTATAGSASLLSVLLEERAAPDSVGAFRPVSAMPVEDVT